MGLLLSPGALLIGLVIVGLMFQWVAIYLFMMVPEILAFVVSCYAIGIASQAFIDWKVTGGLPGGISAPRLNPFHNLYLAIEALTLAVPGILRFWPLTPFAEEVGPVILGFAAFAATFAASMTLTGEWSHYMATGSWAPALPVGLSLTAGVATFATLLFLDATRG